MRLKSYTAPSMAEAMTLIRLELGDDAIIVSTQRASSGKGVRITAALEQQDNDDDVLDGILSDINRAPVADTLRQSLNDHGVPGRLIERLVNVVEMGGISDPEAACMAALESGFAFAPLPEHGAPRPFMMVGPPGAGKSMAVAKLAARSVLKGHKVGVITSDNLRAGASEQLAAFTRILEVDLMVARGPESLGRAVSQIAGRHDVVFIDSPGLNPYKASDMDYLSALIEAANVEPILVLPAGGDAVEATEIGEAFAGVGATRLLVTRLDTSRRLGSILAAADAAPLMFCDVSSTPHVVNGISAIDATTMSRMILPQSLQMVATPVHARA